MCSNGYIESEEECQKRKERNRVIINKTKRGLENLVANLDRVFVPLSGFRRIRNAYSARSEAGLPDHSPELKRSIYTSVALTEMFKITMHVGMIYAIYRKYKGY